VLGDPAALATVLLHLQKVDTEDLRDATAARIAALPADAEPPALIPFSAPARKALELTVREALRLGNNYVGTGHQLLALLALEDGDGPLYQCGVDKDRVEADLIVALESLGSGKKASPGAGEGD
jgi:ATP-dependent Clp protease ATP-binding subunit ClpA